MRSATNSPLPADFYLQDTVSVARQLLGCVLVRTLPGGERLSGTIVETEAYLGSDDPAAHSYRGPTPRTRTMFEEGGRAYVYFIYGNYYCLNAVAGPQGTAHAVLFRALEPLEGIGYMRTNRPKAKDNYQLCNGPGKLCQALAVGKELNGVPLDGSQGLGVFPGTSTRTFAVGVSPRIGINLAADALLRFYVDGSPFVSPHRFRGAS